MQRDVDPEAPRPAKRPRMTLPDGFQVSKSSAPKTQQRHEEFPRFSGAETQQRSSGGRTTPSAGYKARARSAFLQPGTDASSTSRKTKLKALKPPVFSAPGPSTRAASSSSELKVLKAPDLSSISTPSSSKLRPITATIPLPPASSSKSTSHAPVRSILNRTFILPQRAGTPTASHLKPLPPPPPHPKQRLGGKPATKSILGTRIALATDIHTDEGSAQLLSIFLRQHGTGYVSPYDRELSRGVEQSPEKRSKAKNAKYLRGGLAEAANRELTALRTNHMLWEADFARMQKKGQVAKPEVHLRITSVVSSSMHASKNAAPNLVLVRGTVLASDSLEIRRGDITALFRLSEVHVAPGKLSLAEGRDVHIWRPWTHITKPGQEGANGTLVWCFSRFQVFEPKKRVLEPFPMLPSQ